MNKKRAVIWDWNGTIVDDAFLFVDIMNFFLLERGLPQITTKDYRLFFEFPVKNYYLNLGFNFKKESFSSLGERFIEKYKERQFEACLFGGVLRLLTFLKKNKYKLFVVSAQEHSLLKKSIEYYKLHGFFDGFVGVENIFAKGKIDIASSLVEKKLSSSYKVFVVGDTCHDFEVAQSINATPLLVSYGHCNKERLLKKNNLVFDSVNCLYDFFSTL